MNRDICKDIKNKLKIVITKFKGKLCVTLTDGSNAYEMFFDNECPIKVHDCFVGRVANVKEDIKACFVDILPGVTTFLPFSEINPACLLNRPFDSRLKQSDEILVMVDREAKNTKPAAVTMNITVTGLLSVAECDDNEIHISSKINSLKAEQLKNAICDKLTDIKTGLIIRTNAQNAPVDTLIKECRENTEKLANILKCAKTRTVYSKVYASVPEYIERIENIKSEYSEIITDDKDVYEYIKLLDNDLSSKLRFYNDDKLPLKALYCLEKAYHDATDRTVYLPSGGSIVFDYCEAMTVIDVNTGKSSAGKSSDELYKITNMEAASQIARQLRLRNISGIVMVDFINVNDKAFNEFISSELKKLFKNDSVKCSFIDFTALNVCEITRQKKYSQINTNTYTK